MIIKFTREKGKIKCGGAWNGFININNFEPRSQATKLLIKKTYTNKTCDQRRTGQSGDREIPDAPLRKYKKWRP